MTWGDELGPLVAGNAPRVFRTFGTAHTGVAINIIGPSEFASSLAVVLGIDVTMPTFDNGSNFEVRHVSVGLNPTTAVVFQGFTYTSSQAYFAYRGALPVYPGETLAFDPVVGTHDFTAWGYLTANFFATT